MLLLILALAVSACGQGADDVQSADLADLVHVHGLAESAEGVYVATHNGLFDVVEGDVRRISEASHDLMGFTKAGAEDLLASGHPDPSGESLQVDGKPPLLGLVHSRDGTTWQPLSLLGEVDFHSLVAAHDRVYGFDSTNGRLVVSDDRKEWDVRAENIAIIDFAVSPDDPDTLVATAEGAVERSTDGGRSWKQVSDRQFTFVSWTSNGLYSATPDGQVAVSSDDGATWSALGSLDGQPQALHATPDAIYAAASEAGILRSTDGGQSFDVLVGTRDEDAP